MLPLYLRCASGALLLMLSAALDAAPNLPVSELPTGRLPGTLQAERFALQLTIDPSREDFTGIATMIAKVTAPTSTLWLHGRGLDIQSATLTLDHGRTLKLSARQAHVSGLLELRAASVIPVGSATLRIHYRAAFSHQLQGVYKLLHAGEAYVMTQMEPQSARLAFPSLDEPAFKQPWDITLIVPNDQQAVANTALVEATALANGWKRLRFARTENLPSYLIAFAVGPWDIVDWADIPANAVRQSPLKLRGIAAKGRGPELHYALAHSGEIIAALERYFGIAYPFDKLDILAAPDFASGAMENAGLITYRDSLLFINEQTPARLRQAYWGVQAHEMAHQWFGDLVTMPWWDDVWLNEAFATWMSAKIVAELQPEFQVQRNRIESALYAMDGDSLASTRRVREPIRDFTEIAAAFDGITYQKGGAVLGMFEHFVGPENFQRGIRQYLQAHARGNATSSDLITAIAATATDPGAVRAAFASFIDQPGVPFLRVALNCAGPQPRLQIQQSRYLPVGSSASADQTWQLPLCVRSGDGEQTRSQCTLISGSDSEVTLDGERCPDWVMPNADASGYYRFALAAADQAHLQAAFAKLNAEEQRAYADSLAAAFMAGAIDPATLLAALPQLASAPGRQVVTAPFQLVRWIDQQLSADAAASSQLRARVRQIYRPRLAALGVAPKPDESDDDRLLRASLLELLADFGRDPELCADLAARGRHFLGLNDAHQIDADAVPADLRGLALAMAAAHGDSSVFAAMLQTFRGSGDSLLRGQLLTALGRFTDAELATRARAVSLEANTRSNEISLVVGAQLGEPETRSAARAWLRSEYTALMKKGPRGLGTGFARLDASDRCSNAEADEIDAWHGPRLREIEGGPRRLAQAVESIRLCAALKAAQTPK